MLTVAIYLSNFLLLTQLTTQSESLDLINLCKAEWEEKWSYRGLNGPYVWGETYKDCYGKKQSPIQINSYEVKKTKLAPLNFKNYEVPITNGLLINNGHTAQFTPGDSTERTVEIENTVYKFLQLHFHWGKNYNQGAEHVIDNVQYAMEMHLVHQNDKGELGVVGVLFQEQRKSNAELEKIVQELGKVPYKKDETNVKSNVILKNLLPSDTSKFYRYDGSLTTPTCAQGVKWTVLADLLPVGSTQMKQFRNLYTVEKKNASPFCKMDKNYRPTQELNGRSVYYST